MFCELKWGVIQFGLLGQWEEGDKGQVRVSRKWQPHGTKITLYPEMKNKTAGELRRGGGGMRGKKAVIGAKEQPAAKLSPSKSNYGWMKVDSQSPLLNWFDAPSEAGGWHWWYQSVLMRTGYKRERRTSRITSHPSPQQTLSKLMTLPMIWAGSHRSLHSWPYENLTRPGLPLHNLYPRST